MKTKVYIQNLRCSGCAKTITKKLSELEKISEVQVLIDESAVSFDYPDEITLQQVHAVLLTNGYPILGTTNTIGDQVKSLLSCAIGKVNQ